MPRPPSDTERLRGGRAEIHPERARPGEVAGGAIRLVEPRGVVPLESMRRGQAVLSMARRIVVIRRVMPRQDARLCSVSMGMCLDLAISTAKSYTTAGIGGKAGGATLWPI